MLSEHSSGAIPNPAAASLLKNVWIDGAGTSHQTQCEFKDFSPLPLGEGVAPIFADKLQDTPAHVVIAQLPKGWVGAWHENPKPQWIVPLSGHWFVETTDGHRVEMGPIPCSP